MIQSVNNSVFPCTSHDKISSPFGHLMTSFSGSYTKITISISLKNKMPRITFMGKFSTSKPSLVYFPVQEGKIFKWLTQKEREILENTRWFSMICNPQEDNSQPLSMTSLETSFKSGGGFKETKFTIKRQLCGPFIVFVTV